MSDELDEKDFLRQQEIGNQVAQAHWLDIQKQQVTGRKHLTDGVQDFVTKTSDQRAAFGTGSVRDGAPGKGRYDLVPPMPYKRVAQLYERGCEHYGERNWEKGQPLFKSYIRAAESHLQQIKMGEMTEDHCAAVVWNIFGYMWTLEEIKAGRLPKELDDRPPPIPEYVK